MDTLYLYRVKDVIKHQGTMSHRIKPVFLNPRYRRQDFLEPRRFGYKYVALPPNCDLTNQASTINDLQNLIRHKPTDAQDFQTRLASFEKKTSRNLTGFPSIMLPFMHKNLLKIKKNGYTGADQFYLKRKKDGKFTIHNRIQPSACSSWEKFLVWASKFGTQPTFATKKEKQDEIQRKRNLFVIGEEGSRQKDESQLIALETQYPNLFSNPNIVLVEFVEQESGLISIFPEGKGGHTNISYQTCRAAGMLILDITDPQNITIKAWTNRSGGWLISDQDAWVSNSLEDIFFVPDPLSKQKNEPLSPYTAPNFAQNLAPCSPLFYPPESKQTKDHKQVVRERNLSGFMLDQLPGTPEQNDKSDLLSVTSTRTSDKSSSPLTSPQTISTRRPSRVV